MESHAGELSEKDVDGIVSHMNDDHADALRLYAEVYGGVSGAQSAKLLDVDREGMSLRVTTPNATQDLRIEFDRPVETPNDAHRILVDMAMRARENDPLSS